MGTSARCVALAACAGWLASVPGVAAAEGAARDPSIDQAAGPSTESRFQVGVTLLAMTMGTIHHDWGSETSNSLTHLDAALAYGVSPSVNYFVISGLSIGLAPQFIFNVKATEVTSEGPRRETDLMVRVAYSYPVLTRLAVYLELLPGYSIISWSGPTARGSVVAFGIGAALDLPHRLFANVGLAAQSGSQQVDSGLDFTTTFLRIAAGVGMKL
jgi:hypothetical protein